MIEILFYFSIKLFITFTLQLNSTKNFLYLYIYSFTKITNHKIITMQINLLTGINDIVFGISKYDFVSKINSELEFDIIEEDADFKTETTYMDDIDSSLYFEGTESLMVFSACDTQNKDATLFGELIFSLNKARIKTLMKENNFDKLEEEIEEWGEERLGYYDARIDFYFNNNKLKSISWGIK